MWKKLTTADHQRVDPNWLEPEASVLRLQTSPYDLIVKHEILKHHSVTSSSTNQRIVPKPQLEHLHPTPTLSLNLTS